MRRDYRDYIRDIVLSINKIEEFTKDFTFKDFKEDEKTIFAVIRALEITGEAVKNIPTSIKNRNKQIPWKKITGMRDKLIHEYFGANTKVVWRTVKEDLPKTKPEFEKILRELEENKTEKLF